MESRKGHTAAEWMEVWEENAGQSRADVARCLATTEDLAIKAVGKVERERFVWRRETGMFMGMSLGWERMKVAENGQRGGHPLGRWRE